ncbi:cytochrome-c peroxidase [Sphingobium sp. WCS2017Hpa-17]|uniref:cytochrome-c peroxidase n=1 Tax=Sphingobium sp. WCS2017Hpa-17 TaxID=3073638 RepID=UPI00386F3A35
MLVAAGKPWRWDLPTGVAPPPVPADNPMSAAKIELGRRLFYDADLSANGTMACAACHEQKRGFADGNATRPGVHGDPGRRNVPGLANVGWLSPLTAADPALTRLEDQALVPLLGTQPVEMGMKALEAELPRRLGADACYRTMFARAFPAEKGRIDTRTVTAALAAFQRTLIAQNSPYDRYSRGEGTMPAAAQQGLHLFDRRCASCHGGPDMTDLRYHGFGPAEARDPGLIEKTGRAEDAGRFRTPSLRNVAVTGPWWHDGSARTMTDAIRRHGLALPEEAMAPLTTLLDQMTDVRFLTDPRFAMSDRACGKRL